MSSSAENMDTGFARLVEKLEIVDAERFVAMIKRDSFDYTIWRREYFDWMDLERISTEAAAYTQSLHLKIFWKGKRWKSSQISAIIMSIYKYMTFNSSCSYAGLANLLSFCGENNT